jgi:O-methyltransferase involved in polyketide biosynthesis
MQVIEVDHPATQAVKRRALGADSRVRLLPCDLAREGLPDALLEDEAPTIILI